MTDELTKITQDAIPRYILIADNIVLVNKTKPDKCQISMSKTEYMECKFSK